MNEPHQFAFEMRYTDRPNDPYYVTNWDRGATITVVADTQQAAINQADKALGYAGRHRHWVFKVLTITDARLTNRTEQP